MTLTINELVEAARLHFFHLQADITNASNRIEHIRLTTLAQEAENLFINLEKFAAGSAGSEELIPVQLLTNGLSSAGAAVSCCGGQSTCGCGN
jgi:hypothetical protein